MKPRRVASAEELAYMAGIIDADGSIGIKRSTYAQRVRKDATQPVYSERVTVRQVEHHAIELLHEVFGGRLGIHGPSAKRGRPMYEWQVTDLRAHRCLTALRPFLRIKAAQADNALALRRLKDRSRRERVAFGRGHQGASARPAGIGAAMEDLFLVGKRLNSVGTGRGVVVQ